MTEGSVRRHLISLTLPMTWAILANMTFGLADTYFVGQLGLEQLAALTFTFPVIMVLISLAIGLGAGTSSVIARAIGEGDQGKARRLTTDALVLSAVAAVLLGVLGLFTIGPLFRLLGAEDAVIELIRQYMAIWYLGTIFVIVPTVGMGSLRASGAIRSASAVMIGASLLNLALDPLLIFGLAGFPRLELEGAAIATVISRGFAFVAALAILHYRKRLLTLARPRAGEVRASVASILHVGLPASAAHMVIPLTVGVITQLIASAGTAPVAAFGVVSRIDAFAQVFFFAMSAVIGPIVGQNLGARLHGRIRLALREGFAFCMMFGAVLAVVLAVFGPWLVGLFADDPGVVLIGAIYLLVVPIGYGASGVVMVANAALNGMGRPLPAIAITTVRTVVLTVPLAYLGNWLIGVEGIFVAMSVSTLAAGLMAFVWTSRVVAGLAHKPEPRPAGWTQFDGKVL